MLRNVFLKSLRDQYRGLIGWSIGVAVLVLAMAALWPTVRDMPDIEEFIENYPEAFREAFNLETMSTGPGYLNTELFSIMLPALFIVFAIARGTRFVAGEEQAGTLEILLSTPVSRARVLLDKAAALAVSVLLLGAVLFVTTAGSSLVLDMDIPVTHLAGAAVAMILLGIEHGWLALAVGAGTGSRVAATAVAGTVAVAGYVLFVMGALVEAVKPYEMISPFAQALEGGPIGAGWPAAYLWLVLGAIVVLVAAIPAFDRRDVAI